MPDQVQISQSVDKSMAKHQVMKRWDSCFSIVCDSCQNDVTTVFFVDIWAAYLVALFVHKYGAANNS